MLTFTKISLFLLAVSAIALAYFGMQKLRPVIDEKQKALEPSPAPETNYFLGPLQKARNVQELQDKRFETGGQ